MSLQLLSSSRRVSRVLSQLLHAPDTLVYGDFAGSRWPFRREVWRSTGALGRLASSTGLPTFATTAFDSSRGPKDRPRGQSRWNRKANNQGGGDRAANEDLKDKHKQRKAFADATSIIVERGPFSMVKEDVLDLCARQDIFLSPDEVVPVYRRDPSLVLACLGWRLMPSSPELRARAFQLKNHEPKVGPHRVTARPDYEQSNPSQQMVRLAIASKGRYLLVHNLPYSCTISNIQTMFKGCKLMDYSLDNSMETIQFFEYTPHSRFPRDHAPDASERGRGRPNAGNAWEGNRGAPAHNSFVLRAVVVKFATPEDAFSAWRLRNEQMHTFSDGKARLLKCRVLE